MVSRNKTNHQSIFLLKNFKTLPIIFFFILITPLAYSNDSSCLYFYDELSKIPFTKLEMNNNGFISIWNGKFINGCEVVFESNESLVSGGIIYQKFESFINMPGWKIDNKKCADGPGSSILGIENDQYACTVYWEQQAWIDDNYEHQQSDEMKLIVQCNVNQESSLK